MTQENFESLVQVLRTTRPFRVFTVELHGGKRLEIDHADALLSIEGMARFLSPGTIAVWFDHESVLRIINDGIDTEA